MAAILTNLGEKDSIAGSSKFLRTGDGYILTYTLQLVITVDPCQRTPQTPIGQIYTIPIETGLILRNVSQLGMHRVWSF